MSETIYRKLKDLKKLANNPRTILDDDFKRLCDSVQNNADYFKARPLILSDRTGELVIIAGNQRYEAAKRLKFQEVPTHLIENLTEEREKEIIIRDNVANGQWDFELLDSGAWDLQELNDWGVTMPDFEAIEDAGEPQDAEAQIDKAAELNEKWKVCKGDLFSIGSHRLLCGDSTKREDVERLMDGEKAQMVFADPPYGIEIVQGTADGGSKPFGSIGGSNITEVGVYSPIIGDNTTETAIDSYLLAANLFPQAIHIWWGGNYYANALPPSSCWIIWDKENTGNFADAELAWTNQKTAVRIFKHQWNGLIKESERGQKRVHPTQKPVELAKWCFEKYGADSIIAFDPFAGSGMSLIAAENCKKKMRTIEMSDNYCAVILDRFERTFPTIEIKRISQSEAANG